jgi:hypothetical protein
MARAIPRIIARTLALASLLGLGACGSLLTESTADVAGIAGAGIASGVTKSAAGAAAIGLGVQSLAATGLRYAERRVHRTEQDAIADAAGKLRPGEVGGWAAAHSLPIEPDRHGLLVVSRDFGAAEFRCREVVFSVDHPAPQHGVARDFYTVNVCQDGTAWRWASAEPSTARWGGLQ